MKKCIFLPVVDFALRSILVFVHFLRFAHFASELRRVISRIWFSEIKLRCGTRIIFGRVRLRSSKQIGDRTFLQGRSVGEKSCF